MDRRAIAKAPLALPVAESAVSPDSVSTSLVISLLGSEAPARPADGTRSLSLSLSLPVRGGGQEARDQTARSAPGGRGRNFDECRRRRR